jgi:hydroxyacylglutathione hydrolase
MIYEQVKIGGDRNFSYLIGDESTGQAAVVDPAYHPEKMADIADSKGMTIRYLINTHGHQDHTNGNDVLIGLTGAETVGHPLLEPDIPVADNEELVMGKTRLRFIHTPGHTADAVCILADESVLFTGDTLFVGKVGGTGFGDDARRLYDSLHRKLMVLSDSVTVFPGHDYGVKPFSTIGNETRYNPFLLCETFEHFLDLKRNWAEYKRKHGIK